MGAAASAGEVPPWARPKAEDERVSVVWRDEVVADDVEDRKAAALRKKARREERARRRHAESLPVGSSGSFVGKRSKGEIFAARREALGEKIPSPRKELPPVESPTLSNEFAMRLILTGERDDGNDGGAAIRLRQRSSPKLPEERLRRKDKLSDREKENRPGTSPTKHRTPKHAPSLDEPFETGHGEKHRKREKKKDQGRPRTSPTKHRSKHGSESPDTAKGGWGNTDRYKKPEHWKLDNRPTFGEYKEAHGWNRESERKTASAFLKRQRAKGLLNPLDLLTPVTPPPMGVLLAGDKALAVKVGKSVGFGDTDVQTYHVDHHMRRRTD